MSLVAKLLGTLAPSLFAATLASWAIGVLEGLIYGSGVTYTLVSAGYVVLFALPVGFVVALSSRALARSWGVPAFLASCTDDDGSAPRLAGLALVSLAAPITLGALTYVGLATITARTKTAMVISLGGALVVVVLVLLAFAVSRPLVLLATRGFRALENRSQRTPLLTPRRIGLGFGLLLIVSAALAWFVGIKPRIGHVDISPLLFIVAFFVLLAACHIGWGYLNKWQRSTALGVSVVLAASTIAASHRARSGQVDTLLAIWGQQPLAGKAIDVVHDIGDLVEARDRAAIAPKRISDKHPDILLVTFDTVRADRTPAYGGPAKMPALAKLARNGVVFEWAFAAGNVTRRSLSTIATGLSPHRVRGRVVGWSLKLDPRHILLAERLRAVGYDTAGFFWSDAFFAPGRFGSGIDYAEFSRKGDLHLAKRARAWMKQRAKTKAGRRPLFVWLHLFDPHNWKEAAGKPPTGLDTKARRLWRYDRAMTAVDRALSTFLDRGTAVSNPDGRIVVVTSDHGEGLGEHSAVFHSTDLYNSQLRVPLIISGQGVPKGRVLQPVGHADIAPTILELAGYAPIAMPEADGQSLAPVIRRGEPGDADGGLVHASMVVDRSVKKRADAVVVGRFKYIESSLGTELYDMHADPDELDNIAKTEPETLERLKAVLSDLRAREKISPFKAPR